MGIVLLMGDVCAQEDPAAFSVDAEGILSLEAFTVGWEFEVTEAIDVTSLGRVQPGQEEIGYSSVGLFESQSGNRLAVVDIPNGTPSVAAGHAYRAVYQDLPVAVRLVPGTRYLIAVEAVDEVGFLQDVPVTFADPIVFLQGRATDLEQFLPDTGSAEDFPFTRQGEGLSYLGPIFRYTTDRLVALTKPQQRQVFQRDGDNQAMVPIEGRFGEGTVDRVEARAVATEGGASVDWTIIDADPDIGARTFSGALLMQGGRYRLEVRVMDGETVRFTGVRDRVGVGDVYVACGQSNAANYGQERLSPQDDRVSSAILSENRWVKGADPMPNAVAGGGSPWPRLGDLLVEDSNVPVAIIAYAVPATSVAQWQPGGSLYDGGLAEALRFAMEEAGGLKAVLWHQGETDAAEATAREDYVQRLRAIIAQSRMDVGFEVPWGVALASNDPGALDADEAIIVEAQRDVIAADPNVFEGAFTNDFGELGYLYDAVHFSREGLEIHAQRWAPKIREFFASESASEDLPLTLTGAGVPSYASYTVGWEFSVDDAVMVATLGRVLRAGSPFQASSAVALYRSDTGERLAEVSVPVDADRVSIGGGYEAGFVSLDSPLTLSPDSRYVILAEALDGAGFDQDIPGFSMPGFNYLRGVATASGEGLPANASATTLPNERLESGISYLGALFALGGETDPPVGIDALGEATLPVQVASSGTVTLEIPYQLSQRRALQIRLHDAQDGYRTVGAADRTLELGTTALRIDVPVEAGIREGSGYLWAVRLLPTDWTDINQALSEIYVDVTVSGAPIGADEDRVSSFVAPQTVRPGESHSITVTYAARARHDLEVLLQDSSDNWRTIAAGRTSVDPGDGTVAFDLGIAHDARIGSGHVWAVRLLPLGETNAELALDAAYGDLEVLEATSTLVNFASLPGTVARQSSTYGSYFVARLAHDGNTDGDWRNGSVTHTELEPEGWWEIDLGSVKQLDHAMLWNRTDCCGERLADFDVFVSDSPFPSDDLDTLRNSDGVWYASIDASPAPALRVDLGLAGRYLRLQLRGTNYLSLAEVQVLGPNEGPVPGVAYEYYEGDWQALPDFDSLAPEATGTVANLDESLARRGDFFGFRFRACLNIPTEGVYTFTTLSDDGSKLILDGQEVVDNDGLHAEARVSGSIALSAGQHELEVQYFERTGDANLVVLWEGPGFGEQVIPDHALTLNETGMAVNFSYAGSQVRGDDDSDGDGLDLTVEYGLGSDPYSSNVRDTGLRVASGSAVDSIEIWYERPARLTEMRYQLEASTDLKTWFPVPEGEVSGDGYRNERVSFGMAQLGPFVSDRLGFVRLRVRHRDWNHEGTTPVSGWYRTTLTEGYQTHGISLLRKPVYAGSILRQEGDGIVLAERGLAQALRLGKDYVLEITSGPWEGHVFAIDERAVTDESLRLDATDPHQTRALLEEGLLNGASFVVVEPWTLADAYPKEIFRGGADPSSADQLSFFHETEFESYFLLNAGGRYHWTAAGDSHLASEDDRRIVAGQGVFIHRAAGQGPVDVFVGGRVRDHAFVQAFPEGYQLLALPHPLAASPATLDWVGESFGASVDPARADQFLLWQRDRGAYASYFLLDDGDRRWTGVEAVELESANDQFLFAPDRAVFFRKVTPPTWHRYPRP